MLNCQTKKGEPIPPITIGKFTFYPKRSLKTSDYKLGLSDREQDVLKLIALGQSIPKIAEYLGVTPNTATTYKTRVFQKLGVNSQAEAVAILAAFYAGAELHSSDDVKLRRVEEVA